MDSVNFWVTAGLVQRTTPGEGPGDPSGSYRIIMWARPGAYARSTKLSTTFFSPAFSKAMVSLLPSIFTTLP